MFDVLPDAHAKLKSSQQGVYLNFLLWDLLSKIGFDKMRHFEYFEISNLNDII